MRIIFSHLGLNMCTANSCAQAFILRSVNNPKYFYGLHGLHNQQIYIYIYIYIIYIYIYIIFIYIGFEVATSGDWGWSRDTPKVDNKPFT